MGFQWDFNWISMGFQLDFNGISLGFQLDLMDLMEFYGI